MTEVLIDGVVRTIRDSTLTKYNKIKALAARGYTFRKIKDELKCGNNTIQDALKYVPNSVPILTGTKKERDEKAMWDSYEATKRMKTQVKENIPESAFMACAFYIQTRSGRAGDAKNQLTAGEATNIRSIENWARYQEWKADVLAGNTTKDKQNRKDMMGELKEKLKARNGGT